MKYTIDYSEDMSINAVYKIKVLNTITEKIKVLEVAYTNGRFHQSKGATYYINSKTNLFDEKTLIKKIMEM